MAYYRNPRFLHAANQGGALLGKFKEAANQSFVAGEPVYLVTNGDGLTVVADGATNVFLGLAQEDASGTTGTEIQVLIARDGDVFEFDVYDGSTVDAATTAYLFQAFAINTASHETMIDLNTTNDDAVVPIAITATDGTKVAAKFLASTLQYEVGI